MTRRISTLTVLLLIAAAAFAQQADKQLYQTNAPDLLPRVFAGWHLTEAKGTKDAKQADPVDGDVLKEYRFTDSVTGTYTKPGRTITVKAARFADASGAYGAFTFFKSPEMVTEDIGDQGRSNNERVLFFRANVLVDVKLDKVTPTSAGELRELADLLPLPSDATARKLPPIISRVPSQGLVDNSLKYIAGPVALSKTANSIPAEVAAFNTDSEMARAEYKTSEGTAVMTLIDYQTPAIAGERERQVENWHPAINGQQVQVYSKRSGPLVAIVTGGTSASEAKSLLASVNYDADVTWNQNTSLDKKNNIGNLLVNIIMLVGVILGMMVVAGFVFGGFRMIMNKFYPDRVFDRTQDVDIIRLDIGK